MQAGTQPPLLAPLTQEDLGQLQVHLPALKIISYRGPGQTGGVVSSLSPLTKQLGTQVNWIALSGMPVADDSAQVAGFTFYRADVTTQQAQQQGKAIHEYLWPLLHGLESRAHFDLDAWRSFKQLSQSIAAQSFRVTTRSFPTLVWLHDFEMALLPPLLPTDAGTILSHFWHTPWPETAVMAGSPVGKEIVEALLHNKVLGFHTQEYALNFLESARVLVPGADVDVNKLTVTYHGQMTRVVAMPLGIDFQYWQRISRTSRVDAEALSVKYRLAQQVLLGVDRLDYTKGIVEKLNGLDEFLVEHPDWLRRFHYVQLAQPSELKTQAFDEYRCQVIAKVKAINSKFGVDGWEPILYIETQLTHAQLSAWYQAADALVVTPVRDGLNLIAKEYVACRLDEQGVVVLSQQAGVAAELISGGIIVDAQSSTAIAEAILRALTMPVEEKRRRMISMRHVVGWNRLHDWACGFLRFAITNSVQPLLTAF